MNYNLPKRPEYQHPGRLYIQEHGIPTTQSGIVHYANYLLVNARQAKFAPVKLSAIRWHFGIRRDFKVLPATIQGLTDHEKGKIVINIQDTDGRKRFTEAHEMIELLYKACKESPLWERSIFAKVSENRKEQLCHKGAAAILMPEEPFTRDMDGAPPSLDRASRLADFYKTSLTATVHRMVAVSSYPCAMIIWQQPEYNEQENCTHAYEKDTMQVRWAEASKRMPYISFGQLTDNKLICSAINDSQTKRGTEELIFTRGTGLFSIEAKRVTFDNKPYVMSLIHLKK